jgi:pyruvate dehydrogenase E2 component (dihydrolipoamide acetyltransferase)
MPSLGADMEKGTLLRWLVKPGDRVQHGDVIAHIETDKADVDIEVFESGTVGELLVEEGTTVPVGTPLARSDGAGAPARSPAAAPAAVAAAPAPAPQPVAPAPPPAAPTPVPLVVSPVEPRAEPPAAPRRPRVSPLARVTAERMGVDLATVTGTGLNGAITQADVVRLRPPRTGAAETPAAAAPPPPPPTGRAADKAAAMRRAIAAAMARSHREIPAYYLAQRVEMTRALAWLEARNRDHRVADRVLPATLLLKAAALAVHDVPEMNGFWRDDAFVPSTAVHLGVGISLPGGGLIAPAIHDADQLSLDALMAALRDLVARTRAGTLRGSELTDATITVTNLGDRGVETVFGVIYPPQVALVGFGRIVERPWAEDGMLAARPQVTASLTADHRASDGHRGALYLAAIDARLQEPERL